MNAPPDPPPHPTRLGVFYDGGWHTHLGEYFLRHSRWQARPSFAGIHDLMRWYVSRETGEDVDDIVVAEKHYVQGRGPDPSEAFDAVLECEEIHRHDVRFTRYGEKGADVLLALEAFHRAIEGAYDVAVLITGDADFVPLVERLHRLGVRVIVPDIQAAYLDDTGQEKTIRCGRALIQTADHASTWEGLFTDALDTASGYDLAYPFILPENGFGPTGELDGYRLGKITHWDPGSPYGFITDAAGQRWFASMDQLVGRGESLPLYQPVAFLGEPVVPEGRSAPAALGIRPVSHPEIATSPMNNLIEVLRARMSEDEHVASRYAAGGAATAQGGGPPSPDETAAADLTRLSAHMLDDIEAKREILRLHQGGTDGRCRTRPEVSPCTTLRLLGEVYHTHPDYRTEWRP